MRYHWDKNDVRVARNKVQRLLEHETDPVQKDFYGKVIDALDKQSFLKFNSNLQYKDRPFTNKVVDAAAAQFGYSRFVDLICDIQSQIAPIYDDMEEVANREKFLLAFNPELFETSRFTHERTLDITRDFYNKFDKELLKYFNRIYNDRYKSIKFVPHQGVDLVNKFELCGYSFTVAGIDRVFMSVDDSKGIVKPGNTVHEFGHSIKSLIVPRKGYVTYTDFLAEVESLFPELVFYNELGKEIDPFQSAIINYETAMSHYLDASNIIFQKLIIERWMDNDNKFDQSVYDSLKADYCMNRNDIRAAINTDIDDSGPYIISFAVALELYNLYKKDRDKALYLFKKIISAPHTEESMLTLLRFKDELCGFEHLSTEYSTITQECKKQLTRKF